MTWLVRQPVLLKQQHRLGLLMPRTSQIVSQWQAFPRQESKSAGICLDADKQLRFATCCLERLWLRRTPTSDRLSQLLKELDLLMPFCSYAKAKCV